MPITQFPEPDSLNILEIGNSKDMRTMVYSVEKPHPGYNKDPNILNELGHTIYPKMVYPAGKDNPGVIVKNQDEEIEIMGQAGNQLEEKLDNEMQALERKLAEMQAHKAKLEEYRAKSGSQETEKKAW